MLTISRRRFVAGMALTVAWTAIRSVGAGVLSPGTRTLAGTLLRKPGPAPTPTPFDLATATAATFQPYVGSRFRLQRSGLASVDLTLAAVNARPPDGRTDTFSLVFTAPKTLGLGQDTYTLNHASLGQFRMFLVPGGARKVTAIISHVLS